MPAQPLFSYKTDCLFFLLPGVPSPWQLHLSIGKAPAQVAEPRFTPVTRLLVASFWVRGPWWSSQPFPEVGGSYRIENFLFLALEAGSGPLTEKMGCTAGPKWHTKMGKWGADTETAPRLLAGMACSLRPNAKERTQRRHGFELQGKDEWWGR